MMKETKTYCPPQCRIFGVKNTDIICSSPLSSGSTQPVHMYDDDVYDEDDWN